MSAIWELDFYSRPLLDERQKKLWEVVICESPQDTRQSLEDLFRFARYCSNQEVNSIFLRAALEEAIAAAGAAPKRIRFFRRQMNNTIVRACEGLNIQAVPSRRTYALNAWLQERLASVYPEHPDYDAAAATSASVQYGPATPIPLPDAIRGDRRDRWAFVSLGAADFAEMHEWEIGFGEGFPPALAGVAPETRVPGLLIFSPRATPYAAWMSGVELSALRLQEGEKPRLLLDTGAGESWLLADLVDATRQREARDFAATQKQANGLHFLGIQPTSESEAFAGFWLLQTLASATGA